MFNIKKLIIVALVVFASPAFANTKLDGKMIQKAEDYLNNITGLEGGFTQRANNGKPEFGKFYMLRPGKLRLDYDKMPIQLISDGTNMFFFDKSLDQITTIPTSSTPASILTRKKIDLKNADIKVVETNQYSKAFDLKLILKDNPGLGEMKIKFQESPMAISGWELIDATGGTTVVELTDLKERKNFPKGFWNVQRHKTPSASVGDSYYE